MVSGAFVDICLNSVSVHTIWSLSRFLFFFFPYDSVFCFVLFVSPACATTQKV